MLFPSSLSYLSAKEEEAAVEVAAEAAGVPAHPRRHPHQAATAAVEVAAQRAPRAQHQVGAEVYHPLALLHARLVVDATMVAAHRHHSLRDPAVDHLEESALCSS